MSALKTVNKFFPNVKRIVDSSRPTAVCVTAADAHSKGVKKHTECAMAVACKRLFHLDGVIISRSVAYLIKGTQARRFKLPTSVSREIVSFDRNAGFAPGTYQLSAVPETQKLSHKRETDRDRGDRGSKPKRPKHMTVNIRETISGQKA